MQSFVLSLFSLKTIQQSCTQYKISISFLTFCVLSDIEYYGQQDSVEYVYLHRKSPYKDYKILSKILFVVRI